MKLGQIPENVYFRTVRKGIEYRNSKIKGGVVSKETCAFFVDEAIGFSESKNATLKELQGTIALYSSVNALRAKGIKPEAVNINMLMPHRFAEEKLKLVIEAFEKVAEELNVQIATFNGEMLNVITETVVSVDAIGKKEMEFLAETKPGNDIVMTKWVGMPATAILAINKRDELVSRFPASYVDEMEKLKDNISIKYEMDFILKEAASAGKSGAIKCMEVSKGGIYKALWDLGCMCSSGLEVMLKNIPIKQETVEVCNFYDLNPYELYSEGCLLIVADNGQELVDKMVDSNISARVIGRLTDSNDRVIINDSERKFLTKPCPDEMTKIIL